LPTQRTVTMPRVGKVLPTYDRLPPTLNGERAIICNKQTWHGRSSVLLKCLCIRTHSWNRRPKTKDRLFLWEPRS